MFYEAVREFYSRATTYALANLPVNDQVLCSSSFVNVEKREAAVFSQVEFFIKRYYVGLLPGIIMYIQV